MIEKKGGENFLFITPPPNKNVVHGNSIDGMLQLQIDVFCNDICEALDMWVKEIEKDEEIQTRINELINIYDHKTLEPAFKFGT